MDDYPPRDRTKMHRHGIMLFARPSAAVADDVTNRTRLFCQRRRLNGRQMLSERLHITLCDFGEHDGEFPEVLVAKICAAMSSIALPPVPVTFNRLQSFGRPTGDRPIVLTSDERLTDLRRLQQKQGLALIEVGLKKKAFRLVPTPHMTVFHGPRTIAPRKIAPVRWTLDEFVLIDSLRGETQHIVVARWPLRGEASG
jgi:2'-5' RNA ligase